MHRPPVAGYPGLPSPALFKNFRIVHICGMRRDVKIFTVSKPDKKWRNMYRLTSVDCRSPLDPDSTWQKRDFPNPCRFPDGAVSFPVKLGKKFPVRTRRELPSTALKLLRCSAHLLGHETPNGQKFPVFSQLAGIFRSNWRIPLSRRQYLVEGGALRAELHSKTDGPR